MTVCIDRNSHSVMITMVLNDDSYVHKYAREVLVASNAEVYIFNRTIVRNRLELIWLRLGLSSGICCAKSLQTLLPRKYIYISYLPSQYSQSTILNF